MALWRCGRRQGRSSVASVSPWSDDARTRQPPRLPGPYPAGRPGRTGDEGLELGTGCGRDVPVSVPRGREGLLDDESAVGKAEGSACTGLRVIALRARSFPQVSRVSGTVVGPWPPVPGGGMLTGPGAVQVVQSSQLRPVTRLNSDVFAVTTVRPRRSA